MSKRNPRRQTLVGAATSLVSAPNIGLSTGSTTTTTTTTTTGNTGSLGSSANAGTPTVVLPLEKTTMDGGSPIVPTAITTLLNGTITTPDQFVQACKLDHLVGVNAVAKNFNPKLDKVLIDRYIAPTVELALANAVYREALDYALSNEWESKLWHFLPKSVGSFQDEEKDNASLILANCLRTKLIPNHITNVKLDAIRKAEIENAADKACQHAKLYPSSSKNPSYFRVPYLESQNPADTASLAEMEWYWRKCITNFFTVQDLYKLKVEHIKAIIYTNDPDLFSKDIEEVEARYVNISTSAQLSIYQTVWEPHLISLEKHVQIMMNRIHAMQLNVDPLYFEYLMWAHIHHIPEALVAYRKYDQDTNAMVTYAPLDMIVLRWKYAAKHFETIPKLHNLRRFKDHGSPMFFPSVQTPDPPHDTSHSD